MGKMKFAKLGLIILSAVMLSGWFAAPAASDARDCDTNAVIRCGTLTTSELAGALDHGASGPHQSAQTLRSLFFRFGLERSDIGNLKNGRVTKSGLVYVDGRVVARNVKSIGRHFMPGSTRVPGVTYELWMRPPSVSFIPDSLDAFVLMNSDGSMAVAVIKSCGNIIPGVGKRAPGHFIRIRKFNDLNGNGQRDAGEPPMANIIFKVTSPDFGRTVKTDADGQVRIDHLKNGQYLIREVVPGGWISTTKSWKYFYHNQNQAFEFGNQKIKKPQEIELRVIKFDDENGNLVQDGAEVRLSGWQFHVAGPNGFSQDVTTDTNGEIHLTGLDPGTYTITETLQSGWVNTTPITIARAVTTDSTTQTFIFGNKRIPQEQIQVHVLKFNDRDGNGTQGAGEERLAGWQFTVNGPNGFSQVITTDVNGHAFITGLPAGQYTITETQQQGWANTTPLSITRDVTTDTNTQFFYFGNKQEKKELKLEVIKFNDANGNTTQDVGEVRLSGWVFNVTGPNGFSKQITTDASGHAEITGLEPGEYTVSEVVQDGWVNTTPLEVTRNISDDPTTQIFIFGNKQEVPPPSPPETPPTVTPPEALPVSGPLDAGMAMIASMSLAGAGASWLKSKKSLKASFRK